MNYKMHGQIVVITGANSGIGRATAMAFAESGATVIAAYYQFNDKDAISKMVKEGISKGYLGQIIGYELGNIQYDASCKALVDKIVGNFGRIDVLINNAAEQTPVEKFEGISREQLESTFRTNVFGPFRLTQFVVPHMRKGSSIIFTSSVTAYKGHGGLIDYSATKGALIALTRSLAMNLVDRGIRVNAVAPGPVWTPLVQKTYPDLKKADFGADTPLGRCAEPEEIAPAFVYLASSDASYVTGQTIHVNGGEIVNG